MECLIPYSVIPFLPNNTREVDLLNVECFFELAASDQNTQHSTKQHSTLKYFLLPALSPITHPTSFSSFRGLGGWNVRLPGYSPAPLRHGFFFININIGCV